MAGNFLKYGGPLAPGDLPVDAHELIALLRCLDLHQLRGVDRSGGPRDSGSTGEGSFHGGRGGRPGLPVCWGRGIWAPPSSQEWNWQAGITDGDLAFRQQQGRPPVGPNWPTFLAFADRYIKVKNPPATSGR